MKDTLSDLNDFLDDIEAFKNDNRAAFGHVYAASGFRTTPKVSGITMNLDWALIEVPDNRIGQNVVRFFFSSSASFFTWFCLIYMLTLSLLRHQMAMI
jgi:hypothetical protein